MMKILKKKREIKERKIGREQEEKSGWKVELTAERENKWRK